MNPVEKTLIAFLISSWPILLGITLDNPYLYIPFLIIKAILLLNLVYLLIEERKNRI